MAGRPRTSVPAPLDEFAEGSSPSLPGSGTRRV
jgi:hypothetical protein